MGELESSVWVLIIRNQCTKDHKSMQVNRDNSNNSVTDHSVTKYTESQSSQNVCTCSWMSV